MEPTASSPPFWCGSSRSRKAGGALRAETGVLKFRPGQFVMVTGETMTTEWFELRVAGSAGTKAGVAAGALDGIAVGGNGRLCSLSSGGARRFGSREEALDYLGKIRVSGDYRFEAVGCRVDAATLAPDSL